MKDNKGLSMTIKKRYYGEKGTIQFHKLVKDKSDLSYMFLDNIVWGKSSSKQSLLNGSIVRSSSLSGVDLTRSDFEAVRFESCSLKNVSFKNCDLRSSVFSKCIFFDCDFSEALIKDCKFVSCELTNSSMSSCTMIDTEFDDSSLNNVSINVSSIFLCQYINVNFSNMTLGDSSFYQNILRNCTYENCKINADSLGANIGLTVDDIKKIGYVFLGNDEQISSEYLTPSQINASFETRGWDIHRAVANINFSNPSKTLFFKDLAKVIDSARSNPDTIIKADDIRFISMIVKDWSRSGYVPLFALATMQDSLLASLELWEAEGGVPMPSSLISSIKSLCYELNSTITLSQDDWEGMIRKSPLSQQNSSDSFVIKVTYLKKPKTSSFDFLNLISTSLVGKSDDVKSLPAPHLITQGSGSWYEIFSTTVLGVCVVQFVLYGLTGAVIQVQQLTAEIKKIKADSKHEQLLHPMLPPVFGFMQKAKAGMLKTVLKMLEEDESSFDGIDEENIKSIEILEPDQEAVEV